MSLFFSLIFLTLGCATKNPVAGIAYDQNDVQRIEKMKTYHWSLPSPSEVNPYNNQDLYLSLVKSNIDLQLMKKGYKLVPKKGSLEVSFLMVYKNGATTAIVDKYFGTNRVSKRKIVRVAQSMQATNYEIGTLIIDAEDGSNHESLWRGAISALVDRSKPYQTQKAKIEKAVTSLMKPFPVTK